MRARTVIPIVAALAVVCGRPALAQVTGTPRDSTALDTGRVDSARADSARPAARPTPIHPNPFHVLAIGAMTIFAPAAFVLALPPDTTAPERFEDYVAAHVELGYAEFERGGWGHAQSVEAFWNGIYGEAELESYRLRNETALQTVRIGYLHRNGGPVAGGVTLGYRRASGIELRDGVEVGLPLLLQSPRAWMRLEARYVVYDRTARFNWHFQIHRALPWKPLFAGMGVDIKRPHELDDESFARLSLLVGLRR